MDIGEVLLNNGWDHYERRRATKHFDLEWGEIEDRHNKVVAVYEEGKLTLEEYLDRVIFYQRRSFSRVEFTRYMFAQSKAYPDMIELMARLRIQNRLKIIVVSNEARELNAHRIHTFMLGDFVDAFVSSCYVHIRKPDADIFRLALDIAQVSAAEVVFIDNTAIFVEIAEGLGMRGIVHTDCNTTRVKLSKLGLKVNS